MRIGHKQVHVDWTTWAGLILAVIGVGGTIASAVQQWPMLLANLGKLF